MAGLDAPLLDRRGRVTEVTHVSSGAVYQGQDDVNGPDAAVSTDTLPRPRFRGVLHQWSFFAAVVVGIAFAIAQTGVIDTIVALIYGAGVCTMFGVSALFHRIEWTPEKVGPMLQLDKTGIYVMIGTSFTAVVGLGIGGRFGITMTLGVWAICLVLIVALWTPWTPPYGLITGTYIGVGSIALLALPAMWNDIGVTFTIMILVGGILFTGGSFLLALRRPDPWPEVFGYHEVWHVLVFVAALIHYTAVALFIFG